MNSTNVSYYAAGFDNAGHRIVTKICDYDPAKSKHADKIAALLDDIKATSPDVVVAEIISADDFYLYTNENYVRDMATGKPVPYIPPEPTAEEKQAAELSKLDSEYAAKLEDNSNQIIVAATVDQDEEYADQLRQERQALQDEYIQKRSEL